MGQSTGGIRLGRRRVNDARRPMRKFAEAGGGVFEVRRGRVMRRGGALVCRAMLVRGAGKAWVVGIGRACGAEGAADLLVGTPGDRVGGAGVHGHSEEEVRQRGQ